MLVWCEYYATKPSAVTLARYSANWAIDQAPCRISAKISTDRAESWSDTFTLQDNTGRMNVKHPNLLRLASNEILFFYTMRNAASMDFGDLRIYMRRSKDECETWSEPVRVSSLPGMNFINADRVLLHSSGRIILPAFNGLVYGRGDHYQAFCYYSDDQGRTWKYSKNKMDLPKRGAEEPCMVELNDGSLMTVLRTSLGTIYKAYSYDIGETWTKPQTTGLAAPMSTALLKRIPDTADLLLIWNHNYNPDHPHLGERNPLTSAISKDNGKTWQNIKNIEDIPQGMSSGPSVTFLNNRALLTYATQERSMYEAGSEIRLKIIPVKWFYE